MILATLEKCLVHKNSSIGGKKKGMGVDNSEKSSSHYTLFLNNFLRPKILKIFMNMKVNIAISNLNGEAI